MKNDKCKMAPSASWGIWKIYKTFFPEDLINFSVNFNKNFYVKINPQSHSYMNRATCAS